MIRPHSVLSKYPCFARLVKLFTVHGDSLLASSMPMSPTLVEMTAWIWAGSVDTRPDGGKVAALLAGSGDGVYWQLAPRSGGGANAGSGGTVAPVADVGPGADPGLAGTLARLGVGDAALFVEPWLWVTSEMTRATTAASATSDPPTTPNASRLLNVLAW